jgi:hypothetical protein
VTRNGFARSHLRERRKPSARAEAPHDHGVPRVLQSPRTFRPNLRAARRADRLSSSPL